MSWDYYECIYKGKCIKCNDGEIKQIESYRENDWCETEHLGVSYTKCDECGFDVDRYLNERMKLIPIEIKNIVDYNIAYANAIGKGTSEKDERILYYNRAVKEGIFDGEEIYIGVPVTEVNNE